MVDTTVIETRADLECYLAGMVAMLEQTEREATNPARAATSRMMRLAIPAFMRAWDDECRRGVEPTDLMIAVEATLSNMLDHSITCLAAPGHEPHVAHALLVNINQNVISMANGDSPDRLENLTTPRTRAS